MFLCLDAEQATSFPQTGTSWYDMSGANYTVTGTNNQSNKEKRRLLAPLFQQFIFPT